MMTVTKTLSRNYIGGNEVEAKVGSRIAIETEHSGTIYFELAEGCEYVDAGFAGCQFYAVRMHVCHPYQFAANIEITGRTIQTVSGLRAVKIRIESVGDCEPSTFCAGWLLVD